MNVKREATYLTMLMGVAMTAIGLSYVLGVWQIIALRQDVFNWLVVLSIAVLFLKDGVLDMYYGAQDILEDKE
jgi:hypothetical protein